MLVNVVRIVAALAVSYLLGAIPFSLIVSKRFFGIDLREHGSGNLGATNTFRVLGARAGAAVFALDVGKGAAAVGAGMLLLIGSGLSHDARDWALIGVAMASVVGHSYSPYIRLRGGKGVATAAGAIAVLMPLAWPLLFFTWLLVIALSRMVSLGSVIIAIQFPLLMWLLYRDRPAFLVFALITAAFVVWRHRSNLARIARGQEAKISLRGRASAVARDKEE